MSSLTTYQQLQQSIEQYCGHNQHLLITNPFQTMYRYPWLFDGSCIHKNDRGIQAIKGFQLFIRDLFRRNIAEQKTLEDKLKILLSDELLSYGLIADIQSAVKNFQNEEKIILKVPSLSASFQFKRFGENYGMNITGMKFGDEHNTITKLLKAWLLEEGWIRQVKPFVRQYVIIVDKSLGRFKQDTQINLYNALCAIKEYVPWIDWSESDGDGSGMTSIEHTAIALVDQWNIPHAEHLAIKLGTYNGITIRSRLLYGEEKQMLDFPWRKGVAPEIDTSSGLVSFLATQSNCPNCGPRIELSVTAPGFEDFYNFSGDNDTDCFNNQTTMEIIADHILTGIGRYKS